MAIATCLIVPKKCTCGSKELILERGDLRCDDCDIIVALDVIIENGHFAPGRKFEDWTKD